MRLTKYNLIFNAGREVSLVKEKAVNLAGYDRLSNPQQIVDALNFLFQASCQVEEYVWLVALNTKGKPIGLFEVSHGSADASFVNPREIFVRLCLCGANSFVIAHNHPSGDTSPSVEDTRVTKRILEASKLMGIRLLDHIIIGEKAGTFFSYKEHDLLD